MARISKESLIKATIEAFEQSKGHILSNSAKRLAKYIREVGQVEDFSPDDDMIVTMTGEQLLNLCFVCYGSSLHSMVETIKTMIKDGVLVPNVDGVDKKIKEMESE